MKTKNKIVTAIEIAVVLCSVLLVSLPAVAAEQNQEMQKVSSTEVTTASGNDYVLGIYGNANEDDTIDMRDLTYVKLIFFGKKPETELADAKYDGKINPLDFIQIKLIIVGKEKELTLIDKILAHASLDGRERKRVVTVKKPVNRIIVTFSDSALMLQVLNAADKIVGVGPYIKKKPGHAPELSKLPSIGSDGRTPDFEVVLNLKPDIILPGMGGIWSEEHLEKIPDLTIVYLSLICWEDFVQNVRKIGYIIDKEKEVDEFLKWREDGLNKIEGRTDGLSEEEKPRVLLLSHLRPGQGRFYRVWPEYNRYTMACEIAGGRPILPEVPFGITIPPAGAVVDPEWVMEQNPDIIFVDVGSVKGGYENDDPSETATLREDLMNRPELAKTNAVKNGDVYLCHGIVARDATGGLVLAQYMAKCFQPVLFKDVDPRECHQEYLTRLQLEFNVYKQGVFVYPEPS